MKTLLSSKTKIFMMMICLAVIIGAGTLAFHNFSNAKVATADLEKGKNEFTKLQAEVEQTRQTIDLLKKQQEEFKDMLFEERDVPAFLDGVSASAVKDNVFVMDMKTQQFSDVRVPRGMNKRVANRTTLYEDFEEQEKKSTKEQLKEMLTLVAMPIRMKVNGDFESIVKFLGSMENYRQLVTISNVEINSKNSEYPKLVCEFTLGIYSLKKLGEISA